MYWWRDVGHHYAKSCYGLRLKCDCTPAETIFRLRRNGRVHLNRRWCQFSRLLAAEVCASAVVMLEPPCSEVVWRTLATHYIRQFPLHFPTRASPCAITFQLDSTSTCDGTTLSAQLKLSCTHWNSRGRNTKRSEGITKWTRSEQNRCFIFIHW